MFGLFDKKKKEENPEWVVMTPYEKGFGVTCMKMLRQQASEYDVNELLMTSSLYIKDPDFYKGCRDAYELVSKLRTRIDMLLDESNDHLLDVKDVHSMIWSGDAKTKSY